MRPLFVFLIVSLLFFSACSEDNSVDSRGGMLRLFLTDGPVDLKEVWVTITDIEVHKTGGAWINFDASGESIDLLTLKNRQQLLQSAPLEEGKYTGIRLQVSEGHTIDTEENRCDLKIPSGKIEVPLNFNIENGSDAEVVLDFDADKSVHVTSNGHNDRCILRPVILVKSVSQSGGNE